VTQETKNDSFLSGGTALNENIPSVKKPIHWHVFVPVDFTDSLFSTIVILTMIILSVYWQPNGLHELTTD